MVSLCATVIYVTNMTDQDRSKIDAAGMSLEELARLKKQVDESITYGNSGLNARQVTEMRKMDAGQWAKVKHDYDNWIKRLQVNVAVLVAVAVAGIVLWLYFKNWIGLIGAIGAIYVVAKIFTREGHREGYMEGYDAGFEGGINRALGISDKEALEIHEMSTEMQIDEHMVAAFDKKKPTDL
jgi:hypothetical protein